MENTIVNLCWSGYRRNTSKSIFSQVNSLCCVISSQHHYKKGITNNDVLLPPPLPPSTPFPCLLHILVNSIRFLILPNNVEHYFIILFQDEYPLKPSSMCQVRCQGEHIQSILEVQVATFSEMGLLLHMWCIGLIRSSRHTAAREFMADDTVLQI